MEIRRTANAGVLLKLDGISILMDGVCREIKPYPATPPEERAAICASYPDMVCYTHSHKDHYDPSFAAEYEKQTGGVILGPGDLPGCSASMEKRTVGNVTVTPIVSRHIGKVGATISHASFIVKGSKCVWFLGDSSPTLWKDRADIPKPDVLIVPYAYTITPSGWALTRSLGAEKVILLHMPAREEDSIGLWAATEATTAMPDALLIPAMGQTITL